MEEREFSISIVSETESIACLGVIFCGHFLHNTQSGRVQEKCGFKPYRKLVMETRLGTSEPGVLNLLINPHKDIKFVFSHPETLIWDKY